MFGPGGISSEPGDLPVGSEADIQAARAAGRGPAYTLPVGQYPPFTRFPKYVVDFQLHERERIQLEEDALLARKAMAHSLAQRK